MTLVKMMNRVLSTLFACCAIFYLVSANTDSAVTDLTVTAITTSSATVSWSLPASSENITEYELTYPPSVAIKIADTNTTSYELTGLQHWTSYDTCVTSVLIDGSSVETCVTFTTAYDSLNYFAIAAIAVSALLLVCLVASGVCVARLDAKEAEKREKVSPEMVDVGSI